MRVLPFGALVCALVVASCGDLGDSRSMPEPTPSGDTIEIRFDGGSLRVEIADTPAERATGLSNRDALARDGGMLFVFTEARIPWFWMKDTLIPLDMIWIGEDRRIVSVTRNVRPEPGVAPAQLRHYQPDEPVRFTLEVNAGAAARLGLEPGLALEFEVPAP